MRRFDWRVAWSSVVFFGFYYFQCGAKMSLQRDYVLILPISMAIFLATSSRVLIQRPLIRSSIIGAFFGLAATIKPHSVIALPLVIGFNLIQSVPNIKIRPLGLLMRKGAKIIIFCTAGFIIPIAASLLWLWKKGALPYFWEIINSYLPLYVEMTSAHEFITGFAHIKYMIGSYLRLGEMAVLIITACSGIFIIHLIGDISTSKKRMIYLFLALAIFYSIYTAISGQFFYYHWMPFSFFVILLASIPMHRYADQNISITKRLFPIFLIIIMVLLSFRPPDEFWQQLRGLPATNPKSGRVDEIANFLTSHLKQGDRIQPLDFTGGALHAMLIARAEIATPFIYDVQFYHHISNSYIKKLRRRFIKNLKQSNPRFIIAIETNKPWVSGIDTTREFKELKSIIDSHYSVSFHGDGYLIYEKVP